MGRRATPAVVLGAVVALVALAAACNGLTGVGALDLIEEPATSGDAGEDAPSSAVDGSLGGDATSGDDGSVIGNDGGTDAALDSPSDADAAPALGFCASLSPAPTRCNDFDDNVFPGTWTLSKPGTGIANVINTTSRSSPNALHFGNPGGASGTAFLTQTFAVASPTEIILSFAIRPGQLRPGENELSVIWLGSLGGNPYQTQFELMDDGQLGLEEETPLGDGTVPETNVLLGIQLATGVWKRVTMTMTIGASSSTLKFDVEGNAPVIRNISAHLYKAAPMITIGHDFASTSPYGIDYDDLYVSIK